MEHIKPIIIRKKDQLLKKRRAYFCTCGYGKRHRKHKMQGLDNSFDYLKKPVIL